ncbi:MAG: hypothetical protein GC136_00385 [Alphaproteobacteria bacterium]|nr:hypothetical protein [Alphaproteobacteria bacterium]
MSDYPDPPDDDFDPHDTGTALMRSVVWGGGVALCGAFWGAVAAGVSGNNIGDWARWGAEGGALLGVVAEAGFTHMRFGPPR